MEIKVTKEQPVYIYDGYYCTSCSGRECDNRIILYMKDILNAPIGKQWITEDVDQCPNATSHWTVTVTKIFENELGVALVEHNNQYKHVDSSDTLIWIEKSYKTERGV